MSIPGAGVGERRVIALTQLRIDNRYWRVYSPSAPSRRCRLKRRVSVAPCGATSCFGSALQSSTMNGQVPMEIFSGFMVMVSILGFFLVVLWFSLPFVVIAMKGKLDRSIELLESIERRLTALETRSNGREFEIGEQVAGESVSGPRPSPDDPGDITST